MIIVEGPDGGGKSTLVKLLSDTLHYPIADRSMSGDLEPMKDMKSWIEECVGDGYQKRIFDRFALLSGPLYAPIVNDDYQLGIYSDTGWMMNWTMQLYFGVSPVIIYCMPPLEVVEANVHNDESNHKISPFIREVYVAYAAKVARDIIGRNVFCYDYTKPRASYLNLIIHAIQERNLVNVASGHA